jgi:hypothetical protein
MCSLILLGRRFTGRDKYDRGEEGLLCNTLKHSLRCHVEEEREPLISLAKEKSRNPISALFHRKPPGGAKSLKSVATTEQPPESSLWDSFEKRATYMVSCKEWGVQQLPILNLILLLCLPAQMRVLPMLQ